MVIFTVHSNRTTKGQMVEVTLGKESRPQAESMLAHKAFRGIYPRCPLIHVCEAFMSTSWFWRKSNVTAVNVISFMRRVV